MSAERRGHETKSFLPLETREDCEDWTWLAKLEDASGIFFTGGNQLRLSTTIGGTSVARLIRQKNAGGVPIAGTSAGAAFVCEHMIAFDARQDFAAHPYLHRQLIQFAPRCRPNCFWTSFSRSSRVYPVKNIFRAAIPE